jgi:hypothetical protein
MLSNNLKAIGLESFHFSKIFKKRMQTMLICQLKLLTLDGSDPDLSRRNQLNPYTCIFKNVKMKASTKTN